MSSPDFRQYIDLTIYDVDPLQVYDDAINYARTSIPEFQPRQGSLEDAMLQAVSFQTASIIAAINRLPNGLMEGISRLTGLTRREATFSTGTAQFTVYVTTGVTIPSGTVVAYETVSDDIVTAYSFETIEDLVIEPASTTGSVGIRALVAGVYPSILSGQALELISPAATVTGVELDSDLIIGLADETDAEFFSRAAQHFASLSACLTTKSQMVNYIAANYPNAPHFGVFDLTDSSDLAFSAAAAPGYVTVVAVGPTGQPLSTEDKGFLQVDLEGKSVAGLTIDIVDPDFVEVTVDCAITILSGFNATDVSNAVETALFNRVSYRGYDFTGEIILNEIIAIVSQVPGVKYVSTLDFTSVDGDFSNVDGVVSFANKDNVPVPTLNVTVV